MFEMKIRTQCAVNDGNIVFRAAYVK